MNYNTKTIIISILGSIIVSCTFMLFGLAKFDRMERDLAMQRTDLYAVKLVQTVLLEQHSIKMQLTQAVKDLQEQNKKEDKQ